MTCTIAVAINEASMARNAKAKTAIIADDTRRPIVLLFPVGCCRLLSSWEVWFAAWLSVADEDGLLIDCMLFVKVFIAGFCSVITEHTPTCRDLIFCRLSLSAILATVCCWSIDWWRRPIEQLYVIVKMLISCFCSERTIGCCHLAYRERRKLRPQMRKIQTLRLLNWLKPNCSLKLSWPLLYRARN